MLTVNKHFSRFFHTDLGLKLLEAVAVDVLEILLDRGVADKILIGKNRRRVLGGVVLGEAFVDVLGNADLFLFPGGFVRVALRLEVAA